MVSQDHSEIFDLWDRADYESIAQLSDGGDVQTQKVFEEAKAALHLESLAGSTKLDSYKFLAPEEPIRIATILHTCLPHLPGGYSSRAHGLLAGLQSGGADVIPFTRPGFYNDIVDKNASFDTPLAEEYGGLVYYHLPSNFSRSQGENQYMERAIELYRKAFAQTRPNIVHVRSTYLIALPASIAAHQLGIPVIYEVSGLWELVYEGRNETGLQQRTQRHEDLTVSTADRVVTMNHAMAKLLTDRSRDTKLDIGLIPNAVAPERFEFLRRNASTDIDQMFDVGYVGSLLDYEGLDILVEAISVLQKEGIRVRAKIVGGGAELENLIELARKLRIFELIEFTGQVDPNNAAQQFSDIKIIVLPRKSTPATECVTPLKPFEAMAAGRPLIVSDVAALEEVSSSGTYSELFEAGNAKALAKTIKQLLGNKTRQRQLITNSFSLIENSHNWNLVANQMLAECRSVAKSSRTLPTISADSNPTTIFETNFNF